MLCHTHTHDITRVRLFWLSLCFLFPAHQPMLHQPMLPCCHAPGVVRTCQSSAFFFFSFVSGHQAMLPEEYWALGDARPQFDVGISVSSFEHDGLGRYMQRTHSIENVFS